MQYSTIRCISYRVLELYRVRTWGGGARILTLYADDLLWFDEIFHLEGRVRVYRPVTGDDRMSSR